MKIFTHGKKCRCRWQDAVSISGSRLLRDGKQYQGENPRRRRRCAAGQTPEGTTPDPHPGGERWHCRTNRRASPLLCEPQPLKEGESCGHLRAAVYPALRENLGDRRFWRSAGHAGKSPAAAGRFIGLNPIHALYPANPRAPAPIARLHVAG
ncbi:hypothetical protein LNP74_10455 [Klebsiella pneumoniae subsp. pneumoniae]|nr:hypothetical protein [Klebsiella pneumoniae subsp. pneumoniae]